MSIEKFYGPGSCGTIFTPACDSCGKNLPGEFSFQDAVAAKKAAGWKCRKVNEEWEDTCEECLSMERGQ